MSKRTVPRSSPPQGGTNLEPDGSLPGGEASAASSLSPPPVHDPQANTIPNATLEGAPSSVAHRPSFPNGNGNGNGTAHLSADGLPLTRRLQTPEEVVQSSHARKRAFLKWGVALLLVALVAQAAYLLPLTDPAAGLEPRLPSPVHLAEVQPYGVNTFLHKEVDAWKKEKTFERAHELGVGWIKQQFPWAELEYRLDPARPFWDVKNNQNAWDKFDTIVKMAGENGLRVIARIDSAPSWSHPDNPDPKSPPSKAHMAEWGEFIEEFVGRYRGKVSAIQVWNEPNLSGEWGGRPVDAAEYAELLKVAYTYAKRADPNIIVLAAPLATNNERLEFGGNLNELDYLQQLYDAGAKPYFDTMSANAYGKSSPPEEPPSRDLLNFRRVELLREVMERNGDGGKAVWFNEYGWNASPPDMTQEELRWGRVSPEDQAAYTVRGIEYARKEWPWAGVFTIWYLRQVGDIPPTSSEYYFGMVNPDFAVGGFYRAVQEAAGSQGKIATPGEWGPLSPPVQAGPSWRVRLNKDVPGGVAVVPSGDDNTLTIRFTGTDVKLGLLPSAPLSDTETLPARYYVTVDGSATDVAAELPRDDVGHAYIALPAGGEASEVTLVRGLGEQLPTGTHTLQISVEVTAPTSGGVTGGRAYALVQQRVDLPAIGTLKVEAHRSPLLFSFVTVALLLAITLLLWALRQSYREAARRGQ